MSATTPPLCHSVIIDTIDTFDTPISAINAINVISVTKCMIGVLALLTFHGHKTPRTKRLCQAVNDRLIEGRPLVSLSGARSCISLRAHKIRAVFKSDGRFLAILSKCRKAYVTDNKEAA
jgi:hypothetical protein